MMVQWCENEKVTWGSNGLYRCIKPLVDEWDPLGLLALGAPDDEYDCLTLYLMERCLEDWNRSQLTHDLCSFIEGHFGIGPCMMKRERAQLWHEHIDQFCYVLCTHRETLELEVHKFMEICRTKAN
ncbi:hypothetical protein [Paenibacillus arenosi]|uniref:Uncharacterized protein n=1 Tax=Paenibacillus arenosi TaxID=2774142 RepID=A0ABR9AYB9_9BACL|nr:hypothetical protein [Paenibacillus arenosi]MBD8499083.1 hypothetical protein [Paenibacillus arenosi]